MEQAKSIFTEAKKYVTRAFIETNFGSSGAYWRGSDYVTLNPMRDDRSVGSFSIREDGVWYENIDGSHGDVFDLLAAKTGRSAVDVARDMLGGVRADPQPREIASRPAPVIEDDWKAIPDGRLPNFREPPSDIMTYHSPVTGEAMFMVIRYDHAAEGKKEIYPCYWNGATFKKGLPPSLKGEGSMRPLSPFNRDDTIILVEGEKKCHRAQEALGGRYSVACWHGGASMAEKAYLEGLVGCDVILWPDNDDVGKEAMRIIAGRLKGRAKVRLVEPPNGAPKAWDIGDAIDEQRNLDIILEASIPFPYPTEDGDTEEEIPFDLPDRPYTDLGNGERFIDRYGSRLRFDLEKNSWLIWGGKSWSDSDPSHITPMVKETVRSIPIPGDKEADAWAEHSEGAGAINAMLSMAAREPGIPIHEEELDPDPFLFACDNGIIDLRSGELLPHDRMKLCSKLSPVPYNPDAKCPVFLSFLEEIAMGRLDIVDFLQRWFGYSMTGDVSAQTFAIFFGSGANGKSTLVELVARIMGDYGKSAPPDVFIQKQQGGIPNDVAALRGARMVLTTETEANAKLAESKVKSLTGGDRVVARYMRGEFFEFQPTWKIIISTNHRPRISGGDTGIWRRIVLVPFDFYATPEKIDPSLPRKLWEEREGILAWMVHGATLWWKDGQGRQGLKVGQVLLQETQEYRNDEDVIGRFLAEGCWQRGEGQIDVASFKVPSSTLLEAFVQWCQAEGEQYAAKISATAFGRAMRERGYEKIVISGGKRGYRGICPKWQKAMEREDELEHHGYGSNEED